jgi:hypothetical protein
LIPNTKIKATAGLSGHVIDPDLIMFGTSPDFWSWRFDIPLGKMGSLTAAWLKHAEGSTTAASDDADHYYVSLKLGLSKVFNLGFYSNYLNAQSNASVKSDGSAEPVTLGGQQIAKGYVWWNGLYISWTPGMFYLDAHGNIMVGETEPAAVKIDLNAYAFLFKLGLKWDSGLRVGLRGWYFTGNDSTDADKNSNWLDPTAFFCPTEIFYTGARFWTTGSTPGSGNPGNTNAIGVDAFIPFGKTLNLMPGVYWVNWTEDDPAYNNNVGPNIKESPLGIEIDVLLNWRPIKPVKNLVFNFLAAYVIADKGLDPSATKSSDDSYELAYRVLYTF